MFNRFDEIHQGMDVCDLNGDKIGSIKHIYNAPAMRSTTGYGTAPLPTGSTTNGVFEVDTGFLGLGTNYYVPFSAISDITNDCARLNVSKDSLDSMNWDQKPSWLQNS